MIRTSACVSVTPYTYGRFPSCLCGLHRENDDISATPQTQIQREEDEEDEEEEWLCPAAVYLKCV